MKKGKKLKGAEALGIKMKVYQKPLVDEEKLMKSDKMKLYDEAVNSPGVINFLKKKKLIK